MRGQSRNLPTRRIWWLPALALLLPALAVLAPAAPAAAETPLCQQSLPQPSSGNFELDRGSVRPGETTIGVVSGLAAWPVHLFGGSGETFTACLPGAAFPRAEVMAHDDAAYFLVAVPASLRPGSYRVGLLFYEGGGPLSGGRLVRFDVPLTVTAHPAPVSGTTPACRHTHPAAGTGALAGPGRAQIGVPISAVLRGLDPRMIGVLNEYDGLDYIACLAGRASPITHLVRSDTPFQVPVPADLTPGGHSLVVIGPGPGGLVRWRLVVVLMAPPTLHLPKSALAGTRQPVSGSCDHAATIALVSAAFDNSGSHDWRGSLDGTLQPGPNGVWQFRAAGSAGSFSGQILLKATADGTYPVVMRCGGGLALSTTLTVEAKPQLRLSPNPARSGSWLSVSGRCPHTDTVSLISAAFDHSGQHDWDGINGVWQFGTTGSAGTFSGRVLLRDTAAGSYHVGMRCGGGLAASAPLTVRPASAGSPAQPSSGTPVLPATGRPVLPLALTGVLSLLLGAVLLRVARRRPAG